MPSIVTNRSALLALQTLNANARALASTQNRLSTGLKVASARDNGAVYAIAQNMRADVASWGAVNESLNRAQGLLDVSSAAAADISDTLSQLKERAAALTDPSLSADARAALRNDVEDLLRRVDQSANGARFNGLNLLVPKYEPAIVFDKNTAVSHSLSDTTTLDGRPGYVTYEFTLHNSLPATFSLTDKDSSGDTSLTEMRDYFATFGQSSASADTLFARMDLDSNGTVSGIEHILYAPQPSLVALDGDASGDISATELQGFVSGRGGSAAQSAELLTRMDSNGDGIVQASERNAYYLPGYINTATGTTTQVQATGKGYDRTPTYTAYGTSSATLTVPYGDFSGFGDNDPSDVTFDAAFAGSTVPIPPGYAGNYGISLQRVVFQPVISREQALASPTGDKIDLAYHGMTAEALGLGSAALLDPADLLTAVNAAIETAARYEAYFGLGQTQVENALRLNTKRSDALQAGIGNLVDADLARDSALYQAQQVRQQLATQSLATANAQPNWVLSLF